MPRPPKPAPMPLDINIQMPAGAEEHIRELLKRRRPMMPPPEDRPTQVVPDPLPPFEPPMRSVLRRDNMG